MFPVIYFTWQSSVELMFILRQIMVFSIFLHFSYNIPSGILQWYQSLGLGSAAGFSLIEVVRGFILKVPKFKTGPHFRSMSEFWGH